MFRLYGALFFAVVFGLMGLSAEAEGGKILLLTIFGAFIGAMLGNWRGMDGNAG